MAYKPTKEDMTKVDKWIKTHPKNYKLVIKHAYQQLEEKGYVAMPGLFGNLILQSKIKADYTLHEPLRFYIEKHESGLKGKFKDFDKQEYTPSDIQQILRILYGVLT